MKYELNVLNKREKTINSFRLIFLYETVLASITHKNN